MKRWHRALAWLLALSMTFSTAPFSAVAQEAEKGDKPAVPVITEELKESNQEKTTDESKPEVKTTDESKPEEKTTDESKPEVKTTDESKPEEKTTDESKPEEKTTDESKPEEKTTDESKPEEKTTDESKPEEKTTDESKPEEKTTDESKPEEKTTDESKPEEKTTDESKPEEKTTDESKPVVKEPPKKPAPQPAPLLMFASPMRTSAPTSKAEKKVTYIPVSFAVSDKVYDGTTDAEITTGPVLVDSPDSSLKLNNNYVAAFESKDVGTGKKVTLSSIYLLGEHPGYQLKRPIETTARIKPAAITDGSYSLEGSSFVFTGSAITPKVTIVTSNGYTLPETDYSVVYSENINAGQATAQVTVNSSNYKGVKEKTLTFDITPVDINKVTVENLDKEYNGGNQFPVPVVTYKASEDADAITLVEDEYDLNGYTVEAAAQKLVGTGYECTIIASGGNFTGQKVVTWAITASNAQSVRLPQKVAGPLEYNGNLQNLIQDSGELKGAVYTFAVGDPQPGVASFAETLQKMDAGTYKIWYRIQGDQNHNSTPEGEATELGSVTIAPNDDYKTAAFQVTVNGEENLFYTGSALTPKVTVKADDVTLTEGEHYSIKGYANNTEAGVNTASVTIQPNDNYDFGEQTVNFTIQPKQADSLTITVNGTHYFSGAKVAPTDVTVKCGDAELTADDYELSYGENINAGTGTVYVNQKDGGNYSFAQQSATFTIHKTPAEVTVTPVKIDVTFNGENQAIVTAGTATGGTLMYKVGADGTYTSAVPTVKNAGEYTVYYYVKADGNHSDTEPASFVVTVSAASISAPTVEITGTYTYDGNQHKPAGTNVIVKTGDTVLAASDYTLSYGTNKNAGAAAGSVTVTAKDTGNYSFTAVEAYFEIKKAQIDVSKFTWDYTKPFTYDETEHTVALTGDLISLTDVAYNNTFYTDAGTYTAYASVYIKEGSENNYELINDSEKSLEWKIEPAEITPTIEFADRTYSYTGSQVIPEITVKNGDKTLAESAYTLSYGANKNAGAEAGSVTVKAAENGNYTFTDVTESFEIKKAQIDLSAWTWNYTGAFDFDGNAKTVELSGDDKNKTSIAYTDNEKTNAGSYTASAVVTVLPDHENNYEILNKVADLSWKISAKIITPTVEITGTYTYDGTPQNPPASSVTVKAGGQTLENGVDYTLSYGDNKNAGAAAGSVTVTSKLGRNYVFAVTKNFEIKKAQIDLSKWKWDYDNSKDLTFSGAQQTVALSSNNADFARVDITYSNVFAATNRGEYTATAGAAVNTANSSNYELTGSIADLNWKILPAHITPTVEVTVDYTYDGSKHEPAGASVVVKNGDRTLTYSTDYTLSYGENIDAGETAGSVIVKAAENGNYTFTDVTKNFEIKKAQIDLSKWTWTHASPYEFDGTAKTVVISGDDQDKTSITYTDNEKTNVGSYTASAVVTVLPDYANNYEVAKDAPTLTWQISAKVITPTVEVTGTYTYDGTQQKPAGTNVVVKNGGQTLTYGTDYTLSYGTNKNAGTEAGSVIVKAAKNGNYSFADVTAKFNIAKAKIDLSKWKWNYDNSKDLTFSGAQQTVTLSSDNADLARVDITYGNVFAATNRGEYKATARAAVNAANSSNYELTGSIADLDWKILPALITPTVEVTGDYTYEGSQHKPAGTNVSVKNGTTVLAESDYTLSYGENKNAGKTAGSVTVTAAENGNYTFTDDVTATFEIKKAQIDLSAWTWDYISAFTFDGDPKTVTLNGTNTDYDHVDLTYTGNEKTNAGTYEASAEAAVKEASANNYELTGKIPVQSWEIQAAEVTPTVVVNGEYTYDGYEQEPSRHQVVVTVGGVTLTYGVDYTLSYGENIDAGVAAGSVTVTAKVGGNYKFNAVAKNFDIKKAQVDLSDNSIWYWDYEDPLTYDGTKQTVKLSYNWRQRKMVTITYSGNEATNAGTYEATVTVTAKNANNVEVINGPIENLSWTIAPKVLTNPTFVLSQDTYTYDGSEKKPTVTVKDGETVIPASEYTVSYNKNQDAGKAELIVAEKAEGNYTLPASSTVYFTIDPIKIDASKWKWDYDPVTGITYDGTEKTVALQDVAANPNLIYVDVTSYSAAKATNAGTYEASAVLTVKKAYEGNYVVSKNPTLEWTVKKAAPTAALFEVDADTASVTYDGKEHAPKVAAKQDVEGMGLVSVTTKGTDVKDSTTTIEFTVAEGSNYLSADISLAEPFTIEPMEMKDPSITLEKDRFISDGTPKTTNVTVKMGDKLLTKDVDYVLRYENNCPAADETVIAKVYVEQAEKGNYTFTGTNFMEFDILKAEEYGEIDVPSGAKDYTTVLTSDQAAAEKQLADFKNILENNPNLTASNRKFLQNNVETLEAMLQRIKDTNAAKQKVVNGLSDITPENVQIANKAVLSADRNALNNLKNGTYKNNFSQQDLKQINDLLSDNAEALEQIRIAEAAAALIEAMPAPEDVEPGNPGTEKQIDDFFDVLNSLTDHQKDMVLKVGGDKLYKVMVAMTNYQIIKGNGQLVARFANQPVSITCNGHFSKFVGLKLDGKLIKPKHYDAKSGSTIITLHGDYVQHISTGKHKVTFLYADGEAVADLQIYRDYGASPKTGDDFFMGLWLNTMLASAAGLAAFLFFRRKKHNR